MPRAFHFLLALAAGLMGWGLVFTVAVAALSA